VNLSGFIARRIAFNRQRSFSRFIIRLSVVATIISVATMIITLSFVNGFNTAVSEKVFSFWGHVRVQYRQPMKTNIAEEIPIEENPRLVQKVKGMKGVNAIHPFATKYAILKTPEEMEGLMVKGFDSTFNFRHLQPFMEKGGRWIQFNDSTYSREIVISVSTATQLNLKLNDRILIYFVRPDGTLRPDKLTVVGIYKTGIAEYDRTFALGDLKLLRRLNSWQENQIGGYEIFLDDINKMNAVSEAIYDTPNFPLLWETKTSRELYPNVFDWLNVVGTNGKVLIAFVTIIAIINFITCLIILVLERIKMIGILKAMGATDWSIQKVFILHSAYITVVGITIGTAISLALLWLQMKTGFVRLREAEYYMSTAAVKIDWKEVLFVIGGTLILSLVVLIIPSLLVRKVQPIKAIRFS
jgi:lipoprotein-releasing system permease protein